MEKFLLCIDNGLTTTKAVIFSTDGREIVSAVTKTIIDSSGVFAEIDMELQWKNTAKVIREAIIKSGIDSKSIIGIGNSGHGAGLYCLDKENKPVRKAISSMDSRARELVKKWNIEGKNVFSRLYQNLWSGQAIPLLYWLKTYEPESYRKINKILMVKDWIIFNLTGEVGIEYTDASNSGVINPDSKEIDKEILEMFELGDVYEKFPEIRKSTGICAGVSKEAAIDTGLSEGTPVIGGVFDVVACAIGSGVYDSEKYSIIAGTWNVNSGIEEGIVKSNSAVKCSLFTDISKFIYVESSATSAVNLEWVIENIIKGIKRDILSNEELYNLIDYEVEKIAQKESTIIYTPFLYNSNFENSYLL